MTSIQSQPALQIPSFLRFVTAFEVLVVAVAAIGLFFWPGPARELWAWSVAPYNARHTGAIYFAALLPLLILALNGRWDGGRVVLWMIFSFTTIVMLAMLAHREIFQWGRISAWGFWFLYLFLPINSAIFLYRLRGWPLSGATRPTDSARRLLIAVALLAGAYGLALIALPSLATGFWPWRIDAFHGRMYASALITPAVAAWVMRNQATRAEFRILGAALALLGLLCLVGMAWTSTVVAPAVRANYQAPGTWVFIAMQLLLLFAGGALFARGAEHIAINIGGLSIVQVFTLLMGIAFLTAAVGGFMPFITTPPPADAPALHVTMAHGYLLGLFPINVVHNLFHLAVGVGGLWAWRRVSHSLRFTQSVAVALGVLTLMGLSPALNTGFGYMPVHGHDVWLHGIEALIAAYLGFVSPKEA